MCPDEVDLYFELSFSVPVCLVLEADEYTRDIVSQAASSLIQRLPGRLKGVYFLGNPFRYHVLLHRDFPENAPHWFRENLGRVSLLNPVLESLEKEGWQQGVVIVLCSRPPVDVEDWLGTPLGERIVFVRMGDTSLGQGINEMPFSVGVDAILAGIHNPPLDIKVKGPGFFPLKASCEPKDTKPSLVCNAEGLSLNLSTAGEVDLSIHIKALCTGEPELVVKRQRGQEERIKGSRERSWFSKERWSPLSDEIKEVVSAGIEQRGFVCSLCGEEHDFDTVMCPQGGLVLSGIPLNTTVIFTREGFLALYDSIAYPLMDGKRVLTEDGRLFEWKGREWIFLRSIEPYEEVEDGKWALFHSL